MFEQFEAPAGSLTYIDLQSTNDLDIESGKVETSWGALLPLFLHHEVRKAKNGHCFIPALPKPRSQWVLNDSAEPNYRNECNIQAISLAVLDLDAPGAREKAELLFADYEYVIHSTHSHTLQSPHRYRIVIRLAQPIPVADWPRVFHSIVAPIDADGSCGNLSRIFFFPSHDPSAGIKPFARHNPGRALSLADVAEIQRRYESSLDAQQLESFRMKISQADPPGTRVKKHFSGETISPRRSTGAMDLSYEGIKERMSKFLPSLIDEDNRHNFAMRTIGSEVSRYAENTDFFSLIQFIYRASTEFGSKPITDPTGDTRKEFPELISSAVRKFAPEMLGEGGAHAKALRERIRVIVLEVEKIALSGNWQFEKQVKSLPARNRASQKLDLMLDRDKYTLSAMRARHVGSMRELIKSGNMTTFCANVFSSEFKEHAERVNVNYVAQFVLYCARGYLSKVKGSEDMAAQIDSVALSLKQNIDALVPATILQQEPKMATFLETAIKIGCVCAKKNKWSFSIDYPQSAQAAAESK